MTDDLAYFAMLVDNNESLTEDLDDRYATIILNIAHKIAKNIASLKLTRSGKETVFAEKIASLRAYCETLSENLAKTNNNIAMQKAHLTILAISNLTKT